MIKSVSYTHLDVYKRQHQALLKLSPAERDFILSYYEMKIPNATCLAQRYGITRQAADKRLKKIEEKIKKLVAIF